VVLFRQDRQGEELNAFLAQRLGLLGGSFAMDAACGRFFIVDLARLLAEAGPDIFRFGLKLGPEPAHCSGKLAMGGDALRIGLALALRPLFGGPGFGGFGNARSHQRLCYLARAAPGAAQQPRLLLPLVGAAVGKPGLEFVALLASEPVADHVASSAANAAARHTVKGRSCSREGMRRRASSTSPGSTSATITDGSTPPSARISPQGETMRLWPYVSRPLSCRPPWAAANTKQPLSMARARTSTCQCASPVGRVKADGIARKSAPALAKAR